MENVNVEIPIQSPITLNEQQIQMLSTFKDLWPEEDFAEVRKAITKVLAKRIDEEWEKLEKERGWTQETYEGWRNEHMRIPYRDSI